MDELGHTLSAAQQAYRVALRAEILRRVQARAKQSELTGGERVPPVIGRWIVEHAHEQARKLQEGWDVEDE